MDGFLFSGAPARRPAQLSARLAGGVVVKDRTLADLVRERIAANDVARLKTKTSAGLGDPMAIVERFRRGGAR